MEDKDIKDFIVKQKLTTGDRLLGVDASGNGFIYPADLDQTTDWTRVNFTSSAFQHVIVETANSIYDGVKYRKNKIGNIEIRGAFTIAANTTTDGSPVFYLPSGFWPVMNQTFSVYSPNESASHRYAEVGAKNGAVWFYTPYEPAVVQMEFSVTVFMG